MTNTAVQEIYDQDRERRIIIYRRDDGSYFYEEEHFSRDENEMCWIPKRRQAIGFYDSQQTVLREAVANTGWLRDGG